MALRTGMGMGGLAVGLLTLACSSTTVNPTADGDAGAGTGGTAGEPGSGGERQGAGSGGRQAAAGQSGAESLGGRTTGEGAASGTGGDAMGGTAGVAAGGAGAGGDATGGLGGGPLGGAGRGGSPAGGDAGGASCPTSGPDRCDVVGDDSDCNGTPNEGCPCVAEESETCNECGVRVCDPANRAWGECHAETSSLRRCSNPPTGIETCNATGNWTLEACPNPDPLHCQGTCTGNAVCGVTALDEDLDGFGTVACAAAVGTDCDDGNDTVYPGAPELCDGLDNDCDESVDLNDGLTLSGDSVPLTEGYGVARLAWSPTLNQFGVVGSSASADGVFFGTLSPSGALSFIANPLFTPSSTASEYATGIVWSSVLGSFVVVYHVGGMGGTGASVLQVSSDGVPSNRLGLSPSAPTNQYPTPASIATRANGSVLTLHALYSTQTLILNRYDGSVLNVGNIVGENGLTPRITTSGDLAAGVWQVSGTRTINWARINASDVFGSVQLLTADGQRPDIAGSAAGYAAAWATQDGFELVRLGANGAVLCGPAAVPFGAGVIDPLDYLRVEVTAHGTLVVANDYDGRLISLFRFADDCTVLDEQPLQVTAGSHCSVNDIEVGGGHVALAWSETTDTSGTSYLRIVGERLCD